VFLMAVLMPACSPNRSLGVINSVARDQRVAPSHSPEPSP
jgi:hypothetical protein